MAEIISFKGTPVDIAHVQETQPSKNDNARATEVVVDELEKLIARARAGEIVGIVCVYNYPDFSTGGFMVGQLNYGLIGRLEDVKLEMLDDMSG